MEGSEDRARRSERLAVERAGRGDTEGAIAAAVEAVESWRRAGHLRAMDQVAGWVLALHPAPDQRARLLVARAAAAFEGLRPADARSLLEEADAIDPLGSRERALVADTAASFALATTAGASFTRALQVLRLRAGSGLGPLYRTIQALRITDRLGEAWNLLHQVADRLEGEPGWELVAPALWSEKAEILVLRGEGSEALRWLRRSAEGFEAIGRPASAAQARARMVHLGERWVLDDLLSWAETRGQGLLRARLLHGRALSRAREGGDGGPDHETAIGLLRGRGLHRVEGWLDFQAVQAGVRGPGVLRRAERLLAGDLAALRLLRAYRDSRGR